MIRKIITIDRDKCDGCGLCARACHEGAIGIQKGKAVLLREDYCDGLGDCLPACPAGAITFTEREAAPYNEAAVSAAKEASATKLENFPIQLKLVPPNAPWYPDSHLLIAADCCGYACGSFHKDFMQGKVTVIGCPKLDGMDYSEKLAQIFENDIKSITVLRMQVPCCGGLPFMVRQALECSGKQIPLEIVTLSPRGEVVNTELVKP